MCAKEGEDPMPPPQERLSSCNSRGHRRGHSSMFKVKNSLLKSKYHIVPNTGDFFLNQNRLLLLKGMVRKA